MEIEKIENNKRQRKSPIPADEFVKTKKSCFLSKYVKDRKESRPVTTTFSEDEIEEMPKFNHK